jgi:hypothetical protein
MLNDVEFREAQEMAKVDKVKIVACDGKSEFALLRDIITLMTSIYYYYYYFVHLIGHTVALDKSYNIM